MNYEIAWKRLKHILEDSTGASQPVLLCGDPKKDDGFIMAILEVGRLMARIEEEYEEIEGEKD